jgi:hypothetical protein
MKWIGYGLQGVGGMMAVTGLGVFALGKLVERAASRGAAEDATVELSEAGELAVL